MPPKFGGGEKCEVCQKAVYPIERSEAGGRVYHKTCFKCSVCKMTLNVSRYAQSDGVLYCKNHFQENVTAKNTQTPLS